MTSKVCQLLALLFSLIALATAHSLNDNPHHRRETLDSEGKYVLEWKVDWELKRITFVVTAKTRGYIGFGLTSNGSLTKGDVIIGGVKHSGEPYLWDFHNTENHELKADRRQDWTLLGAWENATHTCLNFSRAFDTCDEEDYPITTNKISVIWAYGPWDNIRYHYDNRGKFNVYLLDPHYARSPVVGKLAPIGRPGEEVKVWSIPKKVQLSTDDDTTYICTIHKAPSLATKHHVIGYHVVFNTKKSIPHTHHIIVFKCNPPKGSTAWEIFEPLVGKESDHCYIMQQPTNAIPTHRCTELFNGWAAGGRAYILPDHVGIPFGESPDEYYAFQAHYDNTQRVPNVVVDLSFDIFYTPNLRQNDGGLFTLGHESPGVPISILVPPDSHEPHRVFGHCSPECTKRLFPEGMSVFSVMLHGHNAARKMKVHHFRNGKELPPLMSDDNYAFDFQQCRNLRKEAKVLPGDQMIMDCVYDTNSANGSVVGGFSTRQEMCNAFIVYYNKIRDYAVCRSTIVSPEGRQRFLGVTNVTWGGPRREFIVNPGEPYEGLTISQVSNNHVNWDLEKRKDLQRFHLEQPHDGRCSKMLHARKGEPDDDFSGPIGFPFDAEQYPREPSCPTY